MTLHPYSGTWPSLVQALIMPFFKDDILKLAAKEIMNAKQKSDETEFQLASRLTSMVAKAGCSTRR